MIRIDRRDRTVRPRRPRRAAAWPLRFIAAGWLAWVLTGCAGAFNYVDPSGPRYTSERSGARTSRDGELRVASFNIQFARHVDRAIQVLEAHEELLGADLLLLQEMDEAGTKAVADSLGMRWVYYPASVARSGKDFGNAILSRWPLEDDAKILLPHKARLRGNRRIAVAATAVIEGRRVRVYSVHLATLLGNGPKARREQLAAVLADADRYPDVVIGGDFNSETVPGIALSRGYSWPTRRLPHTAKWWTIDHILVKGFDTTSRTVGVVKDNRKASDHRPIWMALSWNGASHGKPGHDAAR